jgi:hypothetical protein
VESAKLAVYPKSSLLSQDAVNDPLMFELRRPVVRMIRTKSLLDNTVVWFGLVWFGYGLVNSLILVVLQTFSVQMQVLLRRLVVELSKFQVQV